ncbi:MAG TPA: class I SAM-dependent methyltransferase [Bacteroidales bacterium]|nr:class I SAM-dependent methyltransferase [Bacteroidales bacterium]
MNFSKHFRYIRKGIQYELFAPHRSGHGIHSPFLYEFVREVLTSRKKPDIEKSIEKIRKKVKKDNTLVSEIEFGAGSGYKNKGQKTVSQIVNNSAIPLKYGRMLFRLTSHYSPKNIIELGTSLGFSAMYLASGNMEANVITIEGNPLCARLAENLISEAGITNVAVINKEFRSALQDIKVEHPLLVFIDGNHTKEATLAYFYHFLILKNENTIMVFDDIHWSTGMEQAWHIITENKQVKVTVDLFRMGIVFFREALSKQNFVIKF